MTIYPLFPKVVYVGEIPDIFENEYDILKNNYEFRKTYSEIDKCSELSKNLYILNDFPNLKECILSSFLDFNNNVFKYFDTDFEITTSWITKTEKDSQSEYHIHANSYYSGILYFDDQKSPEKVGNLEFIDVNSNQILPNDPNQFNIYNSTSWSIQPSKNKLVFFPSNLYHKISVHKSETPRYSLAFNFFPTNNFGANDSQLNIKMLT